MGHRPVRTPHDPDLPRSAWLFTRGDESVRLEVRQSGTILQLSVAGPGSERAIYEFPTLSALLEHQSQVERRLVAGGYSLEKYVTERRQQPRPVSIVGASVT